MKIPGKNSLLIMVATLMLWVTACDGNENTQPAPADNFDKTAMLANYADNLILPGYDGLLQQLETLDTSLQTFLANPSPENQEALRPVFKNAYLQFERVSVYQVGPAEDALLGNFLNTFPANPAAIENNIGGNSYNLLVNSSIDQQGFPALDYLLFGEDAGQKFAGANGANRKKYVQDLLTRMQALVGSVKTEWNKGYRAQFIANTRTDVGSPTGFLVNQFAYELDQLKGPRVGWPFGKMSGGTVFADKSEGYFAGISGALAVENLSSLKKAYTGNGTGPGIGDYLVALKQEQLHADVLQQFDTTINKLKAIPEPMAAAFTQQKDLVDAAYREVQSLLTLMKTDVASATGVRITYQDSDGD